MLKERGREDLAITPPDGYIEDGNHRALALMFTAPQRNTIPGAACVLCVIRVMGWMKRVSKNKKRR